MAVIQSWYEIQTKFNDQIKNSFRIRNNDEGYSRDASSPLRPLSQQILGVRIENAENCRKMQRHSEATDRKWARKKY